MTEPKNPPKAASNNRADLQRRIRMATAPAWVPSPGDILIATLRGVRMGQADPYPPYPVLLYEMKDKPGTFVAVHAFHTLVQERLKEIKPKIGDDTVISYLGKVERTEEEKDKGKQEYHNYYLEPGDGTATEVTEESVNLPWM